MRGLALTVVFAIAVATPTLAAEESKSASHRLHECANRNIPRLDDRVSPVDEIAKAVATECQTEIRDLATSTAIQDGAADPVAIDHAIQELLKGQMFVTDILEHRTGAKRGESLFPLPGPGQGINTSKELFALCNDKAMASMCLAYFRGWVDAYIWGLRGRCPDADMQPTHFRDLFVQLMGNAGTMARTGNDPAGGALAALLQVHSHPCK